MWLKLLKGAKKKAIESWFFTFFHFFFAHGFVCHLQCDRYNLNAKFLNFSKKNYKVHSVEVLNQDPFEHKNSTSLILTNLKLGFEPHVLNMFSKCLAKDPKKKQKII
jgi:hypothetical protein